MECDYDGLRWPRPQRPFAKNRNFKDSKTRISKAMNELETMFRSGRIEYNDDS